MNKQQISELEKNTDPLVVQLLAEFKHITGSKVYPAWRAIQTQLEFWQKEINENPISLKSMVKKAKKGKAKVGENPDFESEGSEEIDPAFKNYLVVMKDMPTFVTKQTQLEKMMTGEEKVKMDKDNSTQVYI